MSGVRSNMPTSGMTRRSGAIIHSVSTYDHRIHFEYGEIGSHDDSTRTSSASLRSENAHESSELREAPRVRRARTRSATRCRRPAGAG